jgi:hypothetical protein
MRVVWFIGKFELLLDCTKYPIYSPKSRTPQEPQHVASNALGDDKNAYISFMIDNERLDLRQFSLGQNKFKSSLDINELVLFARKTELKYNQDYYEKFVIVVIDLDKIEITPFDWFNKTGGDFGYVWPAVARYDRKNRKLYGRGMRMNDFVIEI